MLLDQMNIILVGIFFTNFHAVTYCEFDKSRGVNVQENVLYNKLSTETKNAISDVIFLQL